MRRSLVFIDFSFSSPFPAPPPSHESPQPNEPPSFHHIFGLQDEVPTPPPSFDCSDQPLTPADLTRTSRISMAVRDAARNLKASILSSTTGRISLTGDDTITLDSTPGGKNTSQHRAFKQKNKQKRAVSGSSVMSSRIGRKGRISAVIQDAGHLNYDVAVSFFLPPIIDRSQCGH